MLGTVLTKIHKLHQVFREEEVKRPVERNTQFLFEAWQLAQINTPPHPPCDKSREVDAEDPRNSATMSNRRQLTDRLKAELLLFSTPEVRDNVPGCCPSLSDRVLSRGRAVLACCHVGHERTIAQRPNTRTVSHFQFFADDQATVIALARKHLDQSVWSGSGSPNQRATLDVHAVIQRDNVTVIVGHARVGENFDTTLFQLRLRITAEMFTELGKNDFSWMDQYEP